jgi:SNF2 family DNA or RNA helicase
LKFKLLKKVLSKFRRRYIMTGSPAPNGLLDLFGQIYILDMGHSLEPFITRYRRKFFDSVGFGGYTYIPKEGAAERIQEKIRPLVIRMAAQDYLTLPPLITNDVIVDLPPAALSIYKQMETQLIAELQNETVVAQSVGVATMKCRQIANGGIFKEDHSYVQLHNAKTEAVQDLIAELGGKSALVAYEFQHDLSRLQAVFPDAPHLGGGVTARKQRQIEVQWNSGCLPVLLAQPQSVAHGLNLQGVGAAVIFHSLTWNLEDYEQLIRRIWRQGQRERVVVHNVIGRSTIDRAIIAAIRGKDRTQQSLLAHLKGCLGFTTGMLGPFR